MKSAFTPICCLVGIAKKLYFLFITLFLYSLHAVAVPGLTTYQARIVKPDGQPLEANGLNFRFTFLNPAGSCILYIEDYSAVSMANSGGLISFSLGTGTKTFPASASVTFKDIFNNATPSMSCMTSGTYSPGASDTRKIVMQFRDTNGWQTLPAMAINAVPYAMYANQSDNSVLLNGKADTAFVEKANIPSCVGGQALHYTMAGFTCVSVGGASGTISASDVTTALGYTPVNPSSLSASFTSVASYSTVTSSVNNLGSSVTAIASTVSQLSASMAAMSGGGISSLNGSTSATQTFAMVYTGLTPNISSVNGVHTFNIPNAASASVTAGLLSNADYLSFSGKLNATSAAVIAALGYTPAANVTSASIATALGYAPVSPASLTALTATVSTNTSNINAVSSALTSFQSTTAASFAALSGSGIGSFNGSSSATQSLGNSLTGTTPAFVTANGVHTLNIPYASAGATTAGLISNADYSLFSTVINKITSSAASIAQVLGYTPADQAQVTTLSSTVGAVSTTANAALTAANTKITSSAAAIEQVLGYMPVSGSAAVNSATITSALGYTPADAASVTALTNNKITSSAASVEQVLGYVPASSGALTSLANSTAASFAAISGSGISSLNGSTSATQAFGTGTSGNSPAFSTAAGVHTLNIPYASVGTTTAGLISNSEYSLFSTVINKITSSAASIAQVLGYTPADQAQVTTLSSTVAAVSSSVNSLASTKITSSAASIAQVLGYTPAASGSGSLINALSDLPDVYTTLSSLYIGSNSVTSGSAANNTSLGQNAMTANSTGTENVAVGESALSSNTVGFANTAMGWYALTANVNGSNNTGIGNESLENNIDGHENTGVGSFSLMGNTSGNFNAALGSSALTRNTTGRNNVGVGVSAGFSNETGNNNVFVGQGSGFGSGSLSDVSGSTFVGFESGNNIRTGGDFNTLIGYRAGDNISTGNRNIVIGYDVDLATATTNQSLNIGNLIFGNGINGIGTTLSSGNIGIGTTTPAAKLDVSGGLRISMDASACSAGLAGTIRYNAGLVEYCNGTSWSAFGVAGAGITTFNGSASGSQSLANSLTGTAPAFVSANGVHTLNIPYASVGTTTAGLISNSEYSLFSTVINKITSSAASIAQVLGYTPADQAQVTTLSSTVAAVSSAVNTLSNTKITSSAASIAEALGYTPAASGGTSSQWTTNASDIHYTAGNVGIGTSTPLAALDVSGSVKISSSNVACNSGTKGTIRYNATVGSLEVCNGDDYASIGNGFPLPASSTITMKTCPAGWLDLGTTSGPGLSCTGSTCRVCTSPNTASLIPANSEIAMVTCPSTWTQLQAITIATAAPGVTPTVVSCQSPATPSLLPVGAQVLGGNGVCPTGWSFVGNYAPSAKCANGQTCRVCEGPGGLTMPRALHGGVTTSTTSPGASVQVKGGWGGSTSGNGGTVNINGGGATDGAGGSILLTGANGVTTTGTARDGGFITLTAGGGVSGGAAGYVRLQPGSDSSGNYGSVQLVPSGGGVGIGTLIPSAYLHLRSGTAASAPMKLTAGTLLSSPQSGSIEYDGTSLYYTDDLNVRHALGTGSAGVGTFNGSSSSTQTLAADTTGTAPAFTTVNGVHTLSIPYASVGTTTAGLISNSDYSLFSTVANKITSSAASIAQVLGYTPAASGSAVSSQWTTSGTAIHYNSGFVGIGTTNPQGPFEVQGGIAASATNIVMVGQSSNSGNTAGGSIHLIAGNANATTARALGGSVNLRGGDGAGVGPNGPSIQQMRGGPVVLTGGNGSPTGGPGGQVNLFGGAGGSVSGAGGNISLVGGSATLGGGGQVTVRGGTTASGTAGQVNVLGGISGEGHGGVAFISGGDASAGPGGISANGGVVEIRGGSGANNGTGGNISFYGGTSFVSSPGTITLTGGSGLNSTGNVILQPGNGLVGVGTTAPDAKVTISGTASGRYLDFTNVGDNGIDPFTIKYSIRPTYGYTGVDAVSNGGLFFHSEGTSGIDNVIGTYIFDGRVGIGASATAKLAIAAGDMQTAPLRLTSGALTVTPVSGAIEYDGTSLYFTDGTNTRRALASTSSPGSFSGVNSITNSGNIAISPNAGAGNVIVNGGLVVSSTGAIVMPTGTAAQRPATTIGSVRYNSETKTMEVSDGASWTSIAQDRHTTGNSAGETLTANDGYQTRQYLISGGAKTVYLPDSSTLPLGWNVTIQNVSTAGAAASTINVTTQGTDTYSNIASATVFAISGGINTATHKFFWQGSVKKWGVQQISGSFLRQPQGRALYLYAGAAVTNSNGQSVFLNATDGSEGSGGSIGLFAGHGGSLTSASRAGGNIDMTAGNSTNMTNGGMISMTAGNAVSAYGGDVNIKAGHNTNQNNPGGSIFLSPGTGSTAGEVVVSGSLRVASSAYGTVANITATSIAIGAYNTASASFTTAIGYSNIASQNYAQAFGFGSNATAQYATAFGNGTFAKGQYATSFGYQTIASGAKSTSFGDIGIAYGTGSFVTGYDTRANGDYTFTAGASTTAQSYLSAAFGRFNVGGGTSSTWTGTEPLFEIGNGSSAASKNNAFTVLKNGNIGINTATPNAKLAIAGTTNNRYLEILNTGLTNGDGIDVKYSIQPTLSFINGDDATNSGLLFKAESYSAGVGSFIPGNFIFDGMMGIAASSTAANQATLTIKGGDLTTAAIRITSGGLTTVPKAGAIEYDGFNFYTTNGAGTRSAIGSGGGNTLAGFSVSATAPASGQVLTWNAALNSWTPAAASGGSSQWTTSGTAINYSTGSVGIGVASPTAALHIKAGATTLAPLKFTSGPLTTTAQSGTIEYDGFNFYGTIGSNVRSVLGGWNTTSGTSIYKNVGNVGIGVSAPTVALDIAGDIQYTGTITDASDRRLKDNIQPLGSAISKVRQIKTYSYVMKDDPNAQIEYGVMAQDMLGIIPNLVKNIRGDYYGVNYVGLIPWSIRAIQEVDAETQNLRRENAEIKRELASVKEKNQVLEQKLDRILELLEKQNSKGGK